MDLEENDWEEKSDEEGVLEDKVPEERLPLVTVLLVIVNIVVYFYVEMKGSSLDTNDMIEAGAMYIPNFLGQHEYYRIVTHFFLHFGIEHLMNNMISLFVLGFAMEDKIGRVWFGLIYMLSGVFAGMVSVMSEYLGKGTEVVSCGASGAIYGLMGTLFVLLIVNYKKIRVAHIPRFLLYIALSLYSGMQDPGIDNAAHIGGFVGGVLFCTVMCIFKRIFSYRKE